MIVPQQRIYINLHMTQDIDTTSDSLYNYHSLPMDHEYTFIHFPPMKNTQSGQSIISWLKELFIDIVSSFFPGVVFASYLVFISILWLCYTCPELMQNAMPFLNPSFINTGSGSYFVNSPGSELAGFSGNSLLTWCFVAFAFMVGFVLQRKDPELPDYVSQIHKAIRSHWVMPWAFSVLYMVVFAFVPTTIIIRVYNYLIYRMDACCGFGSRNCSQRSDEEKADTEESAAIADCSDGLINNKNNRDSKLRHYIVARTTTIWNMLKCLSPFSHETRDYIWRLCYEEKNGKGARFKRCRMHRSKLTKYPYEDYYTSYLKSRGLSYLKQYVVWDRWNECKKDGKQAYMHAPDALIRSRRVIDLLKNRIRSIIPEESEDLVRWETHIRLASAIWYLTKFIIHTTVFSLAVMYLARPLSYLFYKLMFGETAPSFENIWNVLSLDSPLIRFFALSHVFIIVVSSFLNYSISGFLHYIRLKEIAGILDWLHYIRKDSNLNKKLNWKDFCHEKHQAGDVSSATLKA